MLCTMDTCAVVTALKRQAVRATFYLMSKYNIKMKNTKSV